MKKWIIGLLLAIIWNTNIQAQEFTATVNRNPVPEGETLVLTLELKDVDTSASPDLNILSNDFTIMSVSNGYRTNIVNGDVSKSRQWSLVMIPNHSGEIVIPAIELAGYKTQPITLKVNAAGSEPIADAAAQPQPDAPRFKMVGSVDNQNPYVQQQIIYKLKIYDAGGLQGDAPVFLANADDWVIKSLGEPEIETQIINGQPLREITFTYAMFPQKSGNLIVPAVQFNGYYLTKSKRIDPFAGFFNDDDMFGGFGLNDIFARKNPIVLRAKAIPIEVKPAAINDGWWLPASKVELSAEFEKSHPQFAVGEPISRTIYLKAYGVTDNQLPELKFANIEGVKQYPEKPITEMGIENNQIVAKAQIGNVYIPSQSGEIVLPEITVNWFNTKTQKIETAALPAYKAVVFQGNAPVIAEEQPKPSAIAEPKVAPSAQPDLQEINQVDNTLIIWMLLGAFLGGVIIAFLLLKLFGSYKAKSSNHYHEVIATAQSANVHKLREELVEWGKEKYPSAGITNLQDLADVLKDDEFNGQVDKIREFLYAGSDAQWDGVAFVRAFKRAASHKVKCTSSEDGALPKLYK